MHIVTTGDHPATITGASGVIQKVPRQAVLLNARIDQPDRTLTADKGTLLFEPDNTVQHVVAEGNVHVQVRGVTVIDVVGPRGDLNMGPKNSIQQAILSNGAKFDTHGGSVAHGSADKFIIDFEGQNQPSLFHMVKDARMRQDPQPGKSGTSGQPMEIAADQLDFQLANGNQLKVQVDTFVGKASITILPMPPGSKPAKSSSSSGQDSGSNSTTVATAGKFHATFDDNNRLQTLHGWPNSRIVSTTPGAPEKVSTADKLDVTFAADGGVEKLIQTGNFEYHELSGNPTSGGRDAFSDVAIYTPGDQILVLSGSPRVVDGGMTTTAVHVHMNRQTGEGFADDDVKTTYSELKPQPNGALLANSDPIHVTAEHMTAFKQPGIAHYTGNVRLWQTANVIRAPKIDFDNEKRAVLAESDKSQKVSSLFVQQAQDGKITPVDVTADKLTYVDAERLAHYSGNVLAKTTAGSVTSQQLDVYLKEAEPDPANNGTVATPKTAQQKGPSLPGSDQPSKIDHMVAAGKVVVTEPNRRAVGDRLVYTADDGKYLLTGRDP